jgi:hypothetical protein
LSRFLKIIFYNRKSPVANRKWGREGIFRLRLTTPYFKAGIVGLNAENPFPAPFTIGDWRL